MENAAKVTKQICVIGAGPSGLCTIKELKEQGHQVTCFEKYAREGGVFYYSPEKGGVYDSTLLTISNYHMAFSCFPPEPGEGRRFWTRSEYADYLLNYACKFDLLKHIHFNHEVINIIKNSDDRYTVKVKIDSADSKTYEFDSIAICTGNNHYPSLPVFEGQDTFPGKILHSSAYKNAFPFTGQRVLVVGLGETGADVAHELSIVAASAMLSIRRYPSLVKRWYELYPADINTSRALYSLSLDKLNILTQAITEHSKLKTHDPEVKILRDWNAKVDRFFSQFQTKNTVFLKDIVDGRLQYNVSGIKCINGQSILFNDGESFEADTIMCCTGYQDRFDFLEQSLHPANLENVRSLYKHMFHPELGPNIAFIGFARPASGGFPAVAEMQARYFALIQNGHKTLPDRQTLQRLTEEENSLEELMFSDSSRVKSLVNWSYYMDGMAKLIGCEPQILSLDPILSYKLWFGTQFSYQYRLRGPGSQPELAKRVIKQLSVGSGSLMRRKILVSFLAAQEKLNNILN